MKTVSAHIISSQPVSLSRAAKFLSNFVDYDNGASNAISTYLQRTSDAFKELSDFHKKLKSSGPDFHKKLKFSGPNNSEGEKVTEKRKGKNRKKEVDGLGHAHGEASGNDLVGNFANGVKDYSEAVTEKKKRKEKHKRKDQADESVENGGEAPERDLENNSRHSVSKGSEGTRADFSENTEEKKSKKKNKKGEEGDNVLPPNTSSTGEKEISNGKLVSEEVKKENTKKRKNVDASIELDGSVEHSKKKTKREVGAGKDF